MNEMVERVERAICAADRGTADTEFEYEREGYRAMARAAIEAMREPTDEMLSACGNGECAKWAPGAWETMIEAALKD